MRRLSLLVLAFTLALLTGAAPLQARVVIEARYSESANLFSLMDNVSGWAGLTDPAYRKEWARRFGWSASDQRWVDRYAEYRRRTYSASRESLAPSKSSDGMFAPASSASSDPLANHFLQPSSTDAALRSLGEVASAPDAKMLAEFYKHFEPKWRRILSESAPLVAQASTLNEQLHRSEAAAFVARVSSFYRVQIDGQFRVFFVWYPPGPNSNAEVVAGQNFLIHQPPANTDSDWDTIAMHELIHYISGHQASAQKRALTQRFLDGCPAADRPKALPLLEEPLAVAWGQAAYSKYARGRPLEWDKSWYASPVIDLLGHLLWPSVDAIYGTNATITDGIVDHAAKHCAELFTAGSAVTSGQ